MATLSSLWSCALRWLSSWLFIDLVRLFGVLLGHCYLALFMYALDWAMAELEVQELIEREAFVQVEFALF